jgi:hypothetical protein
MFHNFACFATYHWMSLLFLIFCKGNQLRGQLKYYIYKPLLEINFHLATQPTIYTND